MMCPSMGGILLFGVEGWLFNIAECKRKDQVTRCKEDVCVDPSLFSGSRNSMLGDGQQR